MFSFKTAGFPSVFTPFVALSAQAKVISALGANPAPTTVPSVPYPKPLNPTFVLCFQLGLVVSRTLCVRKPVRESLGLLEVSLALPGSSSSPTSAEPRNESPNDRNGSRRCSLTNARTAEMGSLGPNLPSSCVPSGMRTRTTTGWCFLSSADSSSSPVFLKFAFFQAFVERNELCSRFAFAVSKSAATSEASRLKKESSRVAVFALVSAGRNAFAPRPPIGGAFGSTVRFLRNRGSATLAVRSAEGSAAGQSVASFCTKKFTCVTCAVCGSVSRRVSMSTSTEPDTSLLSSFSTTNPAARNASRAPRAEKRAAIFTLPSFTLRLSARVTAMTFSVSVAFS
mmetsp:Transcript_6296/g.23745  ORF Transcript_6296/g.23745 Transcript_6296/m.23745 type:complete len:340 (+) Transcript_6296:3302-4321(+)